MIPGLPNAIDETTNAAKTAALLRDSSSPDEAKEILRTFLRECTKLELIIVFEVLDLCSKANDSTPKDRRLLSLLYECLYELDAPKAYAAITANPERN